MCLLAQWQTGETRQTVRESALILSLYFLVSRNYASLRGSELSLDLPPWLGGKESGLLSLQSVFVIYPPLSLRVMYLFRVYIINFL